MARGNRPRTDRASGVRFDQETYDALEAAADRAGVGVSTIIRAAVREWLTARHIAPGQR